MATNAGLTQQTTTNVTATSDVTLHRPWPPGVGKVTERTIELYWQAFPGHPKYCLQECERNGPWETVYAGNGLSAKIVGLEPQTQYRFRLRAVHDDGPTNWSSIVSISTTRKPITGTDLHSAVLAFDLAGVKELLSSGQVSVDVPDGLGLSPLMIACQRGEVSIVEELIARGANVNYTNSSGKTSLMLASFAGHTSICELLLRERANVDLRDKGGSMALHWLAVDGSHASVLRLLLKAGVDINERDFVSAWTPLMRAAAVSGDGAVSAFLLSNGAAVNLLDKDGKTALMIATLNGHTDLVALLLQHGADPLIKSVHGKTAKDFARAFGFDAIAALLVPTLRNL